MPRMFGEAVFRIKPETSSSELIFKGDAKHTTLNWLKFALDVGFVSKRNIRRVLEKSKVEEGED